MSIPHDFSTPNALPNISNFAATHIPDDNSSLESSNEVSIQFYIAVFKIAFFLYLYRNSHLCHIFHEIGWSSDFGARVRFKANENSGLQILRDARSHYKRL